MNKEGPYRDQAERLRKKVVRKPEAEKISTEKETLPPRSRLHREKRKKNKWKLKYPVISLLALFFILLPITIFSIYKNWDSDESGSAEKAGTNESGYETIGYESQVDEKGTKIEEKEEITKGNDKTSKIEKAENDKEDNLSTPAEKSPSVDDSSDKSPVNKDESQAVEDDKPEQGNKEEPKEEKEMVYHTVKSNETLYRIAMNYYHSQSGVEIIRKANNLNNNEIRVGQVLAIPKN